MKNLNLNQQNNALINVLETKEELNEKLFWKEVEEKSKVLIVDLIEQSSPFSAISSFFDLEKDINYQILLRDKLLAFYRGQEEYQTGIIKGNCNWTKEDIEYVAQDLTCSYFELVFKKLEEEKLSRYNNAYNVSSNKLESNKITWIDILCFPLAAAVYICFLVGVILATVMMIFTTISISADCYKACQENFGNKTFASKNSRLELWVEENKRKLVENQFKTLVEIINPELSRKEINKVNFSDLEQKIKEILAERESFRLKIEEERIIHEDAMKVMDNWYRRTNNEEKPN